MEREPAWRRYLRFWRSNPAADIDDEVRFHVDSRTAEFVAAGMNAVEARHAAADRFGNTDDILNSLHILTRQRETAMRRTAWLETLRQDLQFAVRQLLRNPGFTIVAVLTLALGIGANTAIFSVVYSVLLKPLPYAAPADRLVSLRERNGPADQQGMVVTNGNFTEWQRQSRLFEAFGALGGGGFTLTGAGDPQQVQARRVSAGYWKVEYIPPVVGRYFGEAEDTPDAPHVVVLSSALWRSAFGADPSIVGRTITLSGAPYAVVGVAPDGYSLTPQPTAIWVPLALTTADRAEHADHELSVVGLVRAGTTPEAAVAELTRIETNLAKQYPRSNFDGGIVAIPLRDSIVGSVRTQLLILFGAVCLVLLIACANVTNLLLARAAVRQTELAIRGALGAGRARIVAQLLAESLLLALAGATAGLGIAAVGVRFFVHSAPRGVPRLQEATLNGYALLFAIGLASVCGIFFGLVPALRATRSDLQRTLRDGGRSGSGSIPERLRAALVVGEVSVAIVLLVGAGLLVRSAILLQNVAPGFNPSNLLVTSTGLPDARYPTMGAMATGYDQILASVSAQPGVRSVALVSRIPIGGFGYDCGARPEGSTPGDGTSVDANHRSATPGYFATMGIPLLRGRTFTTGDVPGAPPVVVINRGLAHRLFGDADPIGKRLAHCDGDTPHWLTVVGITGDIHAQGLDQEVANEVYYPMAQNAEPGAFIVVRASGVATALASTVRRGILSVDPQLALSAMRTMDEILARSMATPRFNTMLLFLLGATGLALAAVGIYGVIAYFVTQRTNEIGIRMALGADANRVVGMVVRQGVGVAVVGVAIGLGVSWMASRVLANALYGVSARDPMTFVAVAAIFIAVAVVASFVPARRAAAVDPLQALRSS